jgi:hypothetical protein
MTIRGAHEKIRAELLTWKGVAAEPHRFGGSEFRFGRREIGHVHGDYLVDIPFPTRVRDQIVAEGRAEPHHILPNTGWVSFYIREPEDVDRAIELLRLSFELASARATLQKTDE